MVPSSLSSTTDSFGAGPAANECVQVQPGNRPSYAQTCISTDGSRKDSTKLRVLMVEDDPADIELVLLTLRKDGFDVSGDVAQTVEDFTLRIQTNGYDLILADYNLPQWRGTEALNILCRENLDVPLIVVTGYLSQEKAMECIKQGATDCVLKDHIASFLEEATEALRKEAKEFPQVRGPRISLLSSRSLPQSHTALRTRRG